VEIKLAAAAIEEEEEEEDQYEGDDTLINEIYNMN
jgi:hypothetical protein